MSPNPLSTDIPPENVTIFLYEQILGTLAKNLIDLARIRRLLAKANLNGMMVSRLENINYVSGFYSRLFHVVRKIGAATAVVPTSVKEEPALIVMDFEHLLAKKDSWFKDVRAYESWMYFEGRKYPTSKLKPEHFDSLRSTVELLKDKGLGSGRLGVELDYLPVSFFERLRKELPKAKFVDVSELLYEMKLIKTRDEIELIEKGVKITESALKEAITFATAGVTELEIANEFRKIVAQSDAIEWRLHIVGAKENAAQAAVPHMARVTPETLNLGDIWKIDGGVNYKGYLTDFARTHSIGSPTEKDQKTYSALLSAQRKCIDALRPGISFASIHRLGVGSVRKSGFPDYTRGNIGHSVSVGPQLEEPPFVSATERRKLEPGMILSIELPYYVPNRVGFIIEDMVLITDNGHEEMTSLSRELRT